jgi:hypothetical protein
MVNNSLLEGADVIAHDAWPPSKGLYVKDAQGNLIPDDGTWNGPVLPDTFVPAWQISPLSLANAIMNNAMSFKGKRQAIEYVLATKNSTISDVTQLAVDSVYRPSSQLYAPVFDPVNRSSVVALTVYSFSWDRFLVDVLADYIVGVTIVMTTPTQMSSYHIVGSTATYAAGDLHETAFNYLSQTISLPNVGNPSITYVFTAYPTQELYNSYMTYTPIYGMAIVVSLSLVVSMLCLLYVTVTIEQEKIRHEEQVRTEAEAQFTSFLAHEVRNPLSGIDSCTTLMLESDRGRAKQLKHKTEARQGLSIDDVLRLLAELSS